MGGSLARHNWLQDKIYDYPEIVGADRDSINIKSKEFGLVYNGHLLTVPDIFFGTDKGIPNEMYEIKSSGNQMLYSKGMSQLEKIMLWHERMGYSEPKVRLIMPEKKEYKIWLDMLPDLNIYKLGDTYRGK